MTYTVVLLREEDGGYVVTVPALPGCLTQGDDLDEALTNAREAVLCHVESLRLRGEPVSADADSFAIDIEDAKQALVRRVTVPEAAAVV